MNKEYAKVVDGVVVSVVVSDPENIDATPDGPWILTPYDGSTGKVGVGYQYLNGAFVFPDPNAPLPPH